MTQVDSVSNEAGQSAKEASGEVAVSEEGVTVAKGNTQPTTDTTATATTTETTTEATDVIEEA